MLIMSVVEVVPTSDISAAFKDIDVAILVGAMPRREGMERKDLLKANVRIFKQQGEALSQHAKKTVKVESCDFLSWLFCDVVCSYMFALCLNVIWCRMV